MNTRLLFKSSSIAEILIELALLVAPSQVIQLLLGDGLGQTGIAVARVLGVGLLSVGVAAWEAPLRETLLTQVLLIWGGYATPESASTSSSEAL